MRLLFVLAFTAIIIGLFYLLDPSKGNIGHTRAYYPIKDEPIKKGR